MSYGVALGLQEDVLGRIRGCSIFWGFRGRFGAAIGDPDAVI